MENIATFIANPLFSAVQSLLRERDPILNKELLLVARHMGLAEGSGNFARLTQNITDRLYNLPFFTSHHTIRRNAPPNLDPSVTLNEFFSNPLYSGAIIMSCFLAPLSSSQIEEIKLASYMKEINTMNGDDVPSDHLDFTPFFGNYTSSLSPNMSPNPKMAQHVHKAIDRWIAKQERANLFPKMSKKLLPTFTRQELDAYTNMLIEDPMVSTQASLEWLLIEHKIDFRGAAELRQRWYTNGLSPRSYFVAGGDAYMSSKFLKDFWNDLVDELSVTNKQNRVNINRLHFDGVSKALFYDLTSFTSNMGVQRSFLGMLGSYCYQHPTTIFDGSRGLMEVDMGELIQEYNELNTFPRYKTHLYETYTADSSIHGVAGFLGVYGNIATCTFLHGAVLLQLCQNDRQCACAGDDAVVFVEDEDTVWSCVSLLGILAREKTFDADDIDVVYLKRRTWVDARHFCIRQRSYIQFPSILYLADRKDLSRFRESSFSNNDLRDLAASSLSATFKSAARCNFHAHAIGDLKAILRDYYTQLSFPEEGSVPQFIENPTSRQHNFIPSLDALGSFDYVEQTIRRCFKGFAYTVSREVPAFTQSIMLRSGTTFTAQLDSFGRYLLSLGLLEIVEKKRIKVVGDEALQVLLDEFDPDIRNPPPVIVYRAKRDLVSLGNLIVNIEGNYDFNYSRDVGVAQDIIEDSDSDDLLNPPHEEFSDADISDDDMDIW
jgi:hypothetical protein